MKIWPADPPQRKNLVLPQPLTKEYKFIYFSWSRMFKVSINLFFKGFSALTYFLFLQWANGSDKGSSFKKIYIHDQPTEHQSHEKKREKLPSKKKNTPIAEFKSASISKNPLSNPRSWRFLPRFLPRALCL